MKEALYYDKLTDNKVQCGLCPHECVIASGKSGICKARKNDNGKLYSLTYNTTTALNLDPIEKKPLYHFHPGSKILSVGTAGCNFKCSFCQNWEISQADPKQSDLRVLTKEAALKAAKETGSIGLAYTYNEPLVNFEWVLETAKLFKENDLKNVIVSNGYINQKPLLELVPFIAAANIDVKSFNKTFYSKLCGGRLEPVLDTVKTLVENNVHVELTTLIIPGKNDSDEEIEELVDWIYELDPAIPLHFSRYFPKFKMNLPMTPAATLEKAFKIAKTKLKNVYVGNI